MIEKAGRGPELYGFSGSDRDERGPFADFHTLRHTYISNIGRLPVRLKTHQELARHNRIAVPEADRQNRSRGGQAGFCRPVEPVSGRREQLWAAAQRPACWRFSLDNKASWD